MTLLDLMQTYQYIHGTDLYGLLADYPLDTRLNRDNLNQYILMKLGASTPIYNTSETFHSFLTTLFAINSYNIEHLVDTLNYTYNPIYNYDRTETGTDTTTENNTDTHNLSNGHNETNTTTTYDSDTFSPTTGNSATDTDTGTLATSKNQNYNHTFRAYGNIGVTTTQQMIQAEREVVKFNIYDYIVNMIENAMMLTIY